MRQPDPVPPLNRIAPPGGDPEPVIRPALPYGAVMATGAASSLAGLAGVGFASLPLLWLTVGVAAAIPARHLLSAGTPGRRVDRRNTAPASRFGEFTVPVGLAVIGRGLAGLHGPEALGAAACAVGLAWLATLALVVRVLAPVLTRWPGVTAIDGMWFLAPAALLADAVGLASLASRSPAFTASWPSWLALAVAGLGTVGYAVVVMLAIWRVTAAGLAGTFLASWWIAAGCGGLTAAALGQVATLGPLGFGASGVRGFGWAALGFWGAGSALLIPIVAVSAWFMVRHPLGRVPWPPAFSTGVYALGAVQADKLLTLPLVTGIATVTAVAALSLWALAVLSRAAVPRAVAGLSPACASPAGGPRRARCERAGRQPSSARGRDSTAA